MRSSLAARADEAPPPAVRLAVAEERGGLSCWFDRDQQARDLIATLFTLVNASMDRAIPVEERDPGGGVRAARLAIGERRSRRCPARPRAWCGTRSSPGPGLTASRPILDLKASLYSIIIIPQRPRTGVAHRCSSAAGGEITTLTQGAASSRLQRLGIDVAGRMPIRL